MKIKSFMMKKTLLILIVLLFPSFLFAEKFEIDGVVFNFWSESGGECWITDSPNAHGNIKIPQEIVCPKNGKTYKLIRIAAGAFSDNENIREINLEECIYLEEIGGDAFSGCKN